MKRTPFDPRTIPLLALLGLAVAGADSTHAAGYPRLGVYGGIQGIGHPFILGGNRNGPLNEAMCDTVARWQEVILDASPISEYRRDVVAALRARNPAITLLAYVNTEGIWPAAEADSTVHYPTRFRRLVRDLGGFLYNRSGGHYTLANVNMAKRDATGRHVVAEGIADLFFDALVRPGIWDGLFLDTLCERIAWTQTPAESIDYQRAGYPTLAAFDAAFQAGTEVLVNRLRGLVGPDFLLVGNCGYGTKYDLVNGWMHENFPLQVGGNWYESMFRDPGGYFANEARFRTPRHNYLLSFADTPWDPYSSTMARKVRFGLGTASLGEGFGMIGNGGRDVTAQNYMTWWYDEYAVNPTSGQATGRIDHTGWLGLPLGPPTQVIWLGSGPDASSNPGFETDVTSGWSFVPGVPATLTRDAGTAAVGVASARISVPVAGDHDWRVNLNTTGTLGVSYGGTYSATFWAKASSPRPLPVVMGIGSGEVARRTVNLTTQWRRHQVVLIPTGTGNASLSFFLAGAAGDVWLDDVHLQAGATNLWRRDFQNGVVLVNPSATPLTTPLSRTYRRIAGVVDPVVNDGLPVSQVTVGAQDALFLIGDDNTPPAPVLDMRPVPR